MRMRRFKSYIGGSVWINCEAVLAIGPGPETETSTICMGADLQFVVEGEPRDIALRVAKAALGADHEVEQETL
jgi:hypothetical protein